MNKKYIAVLPLILVILFQNCKSDSTANSVFGTGADSATAEQKPVEKPIDTLALRTLADSLLRHYNYDSSWAQMTPVIPGAILPFHRIVAFYGNLNSTRMGILGEIPKDQMIKKLFGEVENWQRADSTVKVIPALHLIVTVAQKDPGRDKMYRGRMNSNMIKKIIHWADSIDALVFLDIQVGHSTLLRELQPLDSFLSLPRVHLGIDAEFAMHTKKVPGTIMGQFEAEEINQAIDFLQQKVRENHLPPKILIIHRFKRKMIQNADRIKNPPEVQVVMDMDGWGNKELKFSSWRDYIRKEPVQYTGFKLFYKNDTKSGTPLLTPTEVLTRTPQPLYIQYQ